MTSNLHKPCCLLLVTGLCCLLATAHLAIGEDVPSTTSTVVREGTPAGWGSEFRLHLRHLHTGESIDVAYRRGDLYLDSGVAMLNHFLRDSRTDENAQYDMREFDLLHSIMARLHRPNNTIEIICGYRSPQSNEYLRTLSAATGVAEHSQHILSKAIDLRVPGVSSRHLRDVALSLGMGGVGFYPQSHFVHVDVGPVRQWSFGEQRRFVASRKNGRGHRRHHSG